MPMRIPISAAAFLTILAFAGSLGSSATVEDARVNAILTALATLPVECEHECFECKDVDSHYLVESTNKKHTTIHLEQCDNKGDCGPHECEQTFGAASGQAVFDAIEDLRKLPRELAVQAAALSPQLRLGAAGSFLQVIACEGRVIANIPLSGARAGE